MTTDRTQGTVRGTGAGRVVFAGGAPHAVLRAEPGMSEDWRVVLDRWRAPVRAHGDGVTIGSRGPLRLVRTRADSRADVSLGTRVPWSIAVAGGVDRLVGDLRGLTVTGIGIDGGARHLELSLPQPEGTVRIRVGRGVSRVAITRPPGAAVELVVRGGVGDARLDGERLSRVGSLEWQSPGASQAADRYVLELARGVRDIDVAVDAGGGEAVAPGGEGD